MHHYLKLIISDHKIIKKYFIKLSSKTVNAVLGHNSSKPLKIDDIIGFVEYKCFLHAFILFYLVYILKI